MCGPLLNSICISTALQSQAGGSHTINFQIRKRWDWCLFPICPWLLPLPAFSVQTLTSTRWLLEGCADGVNNPLWHTILTMDEKKQDLFMQRVLFLHNRASRRGGRAASSRLTASEWNNEAERMCTACFIFEQMAMAVSHTGEKMFAGDVLQKVIKRCIDGCLVLIILWVRPSNFQPQFSTNWWVTLVSYPFSSKTNLANPRDYTSELTALVTVKDAQFQVHHTDMWILGSAWLSWTAFQKSN